MTTTPLTAAFGFGGGNGMSRAERSAKAKAQLRDRFGRWIEMGGLARFRVSSPGGGQGTWYHGTVTGQDVSTGKVTVRLEDGRSVTVPNSKMEQPKAVINLSPQGAHNDAPATPATPSGTGRQRASLRAQIRALGIDDATAGRIDARLGQLYQRYGAKTDGLESALDNPHIDSKGNIAYIGFRDRGRIVLGLNPNTVSDQAMMTRSNANGYMVSKDIEGVITHEYGHLLASMAPQGWSVKDRARYDTETYQQLADTYFQGSTTAMLAAMRNVSAYAGTNHDETVAELFASYHLNPDAADWLRAWGTRMDNLFSGDVEKPSSSISTTSPLATPTMRQIVSDLNSKDLQDKILTLQKGALFSDAQREAYVELLSELLHRNPSFILPLSTQNRLTEINKAYGENGLWNTLLEVIPRGVMGRRTEPDVSVPSLDEIISERAPAPAPAPAPRQAPIPGNAVVTPGPPADQKAWNQRVRPKRGVMQKFDTPESAADEMRAREPGLTPVSWSTSGSGVGVDSSGHRFLFNRGTGAIIPWEDLDDTIRQSWEGKLMDVPGAPVPISAAGEPQPDFSDGAMIALPVPGGTASRIAHPDGLPPGDLHVTLAFLGPGNALTSTERQGIHDAAREAANVSYPLPATIPAGSGTFNNPDEQPYWFDPGCPAIHGLRDSLMQGLASRGLDHLVSTDHPFTPHITIRYLSPDEPAPLDAATPTPAPATFTHLQVVLGDELPTNYPLGGRDVTVPPEMATPITTSPAATNPTLLQDAASPAPRARPLRIPPRTELSLRRAVELHNRTAPLGRRASLEMVKAVYSRAPHSPVSRVDSFLTALSRRAQHPDDDLFPVAFTPTSLGRALTLAGEHQADEVRDLVITAASSPPSSPLHVFHLSRALAATILLPPLSRVALAPALRALIADGNSAAARSLRAKRQLRDRFGKWIEMGGGIRFKIRSPGAPGGGTWYHGRVEGIDVPNGRVDVRLEDGRLVKVPADKVEQPKAILNLPGTPATPEPDDPSAPEVTPEEVKSPTQATLPAGSLHDVIDAADDSANHLLSRVPASSTAAEQRKKAIANVDQLVDDLGNGVAHPESVVDGLHQVAEFASTYADSPSLSPDERDAFKAYADDVLDIAAGIDPSQVYDAGASPAPSSKPTYDPQNKQDENEPLVAVHAATADLADDFPSESPLNEKLSALANVLGQLIIQKDTLSPADRTKTLSALDGFIDSVLDEHLDDLGANGEDALTEIQSSIAKEIHAAPAPAPAPAPEKILGTEVGFTRINGVITDDELNAYEKYTGNGFKPMNKLLRTGQLDPAPDGSAIWQKQMADPEHVAALSKSLNSLISRSRLATDLTTWRGTGDADFIDGLQVGSIVSDKGFVSTSHDKEVADAFASKAIFEIKLPAGTHAVDVDALGNTGSYGDYEDPEEEPGESEILLASGTNFKVTGLEDLGGFLHVTMELTNEKAVISDDTIPRGTTPDPGAAPSQPEGTPELDPGAGGGDSPEAGGVDPTTDLLGNPIPDGLATLFGERTLPNGTTVQDYVIPGTSPEAKNGFSVMVGEKNGKPVYALRQAFGAHQPVGNYTSWDEVQAAVDDARGVKSTTDQKVAEKKQVAADALQAKITRHEKLKAQGVDDAGRPFPEGWSRDITPEGQTIYTGPGRYRAVNADDSKTPATNDLILLVRMPDNTFTTVNDFPDWLSLTAGVKQDQAARSKDHREQFANWLEGHGFSPATTSKVRNAPSIDDAQIAIAADPQFSKLVLANGEAAKADFPTPEEKQAQKSVTEMKSFIQGLQPIPDQVPAPQEPPPNQTPAYKLSNSAQGELGDFIDHFSIPASTDEALDSFLLHGDSSKLREESGAELLGEKLRSYLDSVKDEVGAQTHDELLKLSKDLDFVTHETDLSPTPNAPVPEVPSGGGGVDLAIPQHDVTNWELVSGQKGYNAGGTYRAPDGTEYYVKVPQSPAHAHNEVLVSALYNKLGVPSAEVTLGTYGPDKTFRIVSKIVPGAKVDLSERLQDKTYLGKIQSGLAIDAWLANWDVVGPKYDNIISDANDNPVRIDGGGALMFRGAGGKKGSLFGYESHETTTLRDFNKAPKPSKVYGSMGEADIKESVKKLLSVTPDDIKGIVESTGFSAIEKAELSDKLTARREFLLKKYGLLDPSPADVEQTIVKLTDAKLNDPVLQPAAAGKVRIAADGHTQLEIGMKIVSTKDGTTGVVFKHDPSDKYVKIKRDSDGKVIARATKTLLPTDTAPTPAMKTPSAPDKVEPIPGQEPIDWNKVPPYKAAKKALPSKKAAKKTVQSTPVPTPWEQQLLEDFTPAAPPATPDLATTGTWMISGKAVKKNDEIYVKSSTGGSWEKKYVVDAVHDNAALSVSSAPGAPGNQWIYSTDWTVWPNAIEAKKTNETFPPHGATIPLSYKNEGGPAKVGDIVSEDTNDPYYNPTYVLLGHGINPTTGQAYFIFEDDAGFAFNAGPTAIKVSSVVDDGETPDVAPEPVTLGPGYAQLDPAATPMYVNKQTKGVIVIEPDGSVNHYTNFGGVSASWGKLENYGKNPGWEAWSPATEAAPKLNHPSWETWTPENSPTPTPTSAPTVPSGPPSGVQSVMAGDGNQIYAGVSVMGADGQVGVVKSIEPNGKYVKVKFPDGTKARAASKLKLITGGNAPVQSQPPVPAKKKTPVAAPTTLAPGTLNGPTLNGTARVSQAVSYVTESTRNATQGISVATDSGDVEDLNVRVMRVNVDGEERLLLKFKLTDWAGKALASRQAQSGWQNKTWKLNLFKKNPGQLLSTNTSNAGVSGVAGAAGTLKTLDLDNGAHIEHRTGKNDTGVRALHNLVEIYLPVDADEETIRQALFASGVNVPDNAKDADMRTFIENRMISMLDGFTDPKKNREGSDRQASLDRIMKKYGVTAESFSVEHGAGGRIDVVSPPELRQQLSDETKIKAMHHNVAINVKTSGAATPEEKGERYLDALEALFTDEKGLRSTVNRWTEGVLTNGMSSSKDIGTGGADYVFFRPNTGGLATTGSTVSGFHYDSPGQHPSLTIMIDPRETIFRNLAWNANSNDKYGKRLPGDILARTNISAHEIMPKDAVAWEQVHSVRLSEWYRAGLVKRLKGKGVTMIGGRTVDEFFAMDGEQIIPAPGVGPSPVADLPAAPVGGEVVAP